MPDLRHYEHLDERSLAGARQALATLQGADLVEPEEAEAIEERIEARKTKAVREAEEEARRRAEREPIDSLLTRLGRLIEDYGRLLRR